MFACMRAFALDEPVIKDDVDGRRVIFGVGPVIRRQILRFILIKRVSVFLIVVGDLGSTSGREAHLGQTRGTS